MRKTKTYIMGLMLIVGSLCQAQKLDIKPYFIYHQSVSKQTEPAFYDDYTLDFHDKGDFTLATGPEYGFVIGYTSRNHLGFELGLGYFKSLTDTIEVPVPTPLPPTIGFGNTLLLGRAKWNYHSIVVRPLFNYAATTGKSTFIGRIGPTIHYASATRNVFYMNEEIFTCTFDNRLNWGYSTGLEYNYQLMEKLSLAVELGFEQYKYTPDKATVEYKKRPVPSGKKEKEEILYVNKIIEETDYYSLPQNKRLKESILFNNIYFGIGIKYNLWEK